MNKKQILFIEDIEILVIETVPTLKQCSPYLHIFVFVLTPRIGTYHLVKC